MDTIAQKPITLKSIFYVGDIRETLIGHICAEIFKDRLYAPYLEGKRDLTILDIGAHIGLFTTYAQPYAKKIYSVEPLLQHYTTLVQMISFNNFTNVEPRRVAIANKNGVADLYTPPNQTASSLLKAFDDDKIINIEKVETVTIEKFLNDNAIETVDFMKFDAEGAEFEVFGGKAFKNISKRIKTIVTEIHPWAQRNVNQPVEALKNNGYQIQPLKSDAMVLMATRI